MRTAFLPVRLLPPARLPRLTHTRACTTITSPQNPRIKTTRTLLRRRQREKANLILLEGPRLITDALHTHAEPIEVFHTTEASDAPLCAARAAGARLTHVTSDVLRTLCDTTTPQGLLGVFRRPVTTFPKGASLILVCDHVRDPGNLGTLVRSAAAAGVDAVLLTAGCADVWAMKTLRAGMGAQFRVPVLSNVSWGEVVDHCRGMDVFVADGDAEARYGDVDWTRPCVLVVGSEADGPSSEAFEIGKGVKIGMSNSVESLNAAMAGTVMLFEAARQRGLVAVAS